MTKNDATSKAKPPAEWCESGFTPITYVDILGQRQIVKDGLAGDYFGKYAEHASKIIRESKCILGPIGELGHAPHYRIKPDDRGFCPFYVVEDNACMLAKERPDRCQR
jgi:hypothetical protein